MLWSHSLFIVYLCRDTPLKEGGRLKRKQEVMIGITTYLLPLCSDFLPFDERDKILYNYNSTCNGEPDLSTDSDKKKSSSIHERFQKHPWTCHQIPFTSTCVLMTILMQHVVIHKAEAIINHKPTPHCRWSALWFVLFK